MAKTEKNIRQDSKARMKRYRAEMIEKGYTSTTVFLSQEHRAELKRLGDEYRLTRAEAAEHIFKAYLESDNKDVSQAYNINTDQVSEIHAAIAALEARVKILEERGLNQPEEKKGQEQDIEPPVDIFETVDNDGDVLELELELVDESEDMDSLVLEPDDSEDKDVTHTDNTNAEQKVKPPGAMQDHPAEKSISNLLDSINPENITREDRDRLVLKLYEQFPGKTQAKDRIRALNDAGILLNGEPWTTKQYSDQLNLARKRAKK